MDKKQLQWQWAAVGVLGLAVASGARADGYQAVKTADPLPIVKGVEVEAGLGFMQGEANEYVYRRDGSKLSQLVWGFDNNLVFKGGIAVRPWSWLAVGARFMTNITDGSGMDDYDWIPESDPEDGCPGDKCHSHHPNTDLEEYLSVDAYAAATFYQNRWLTLTALAGYKRDSAQWQAYDGLSNYSNDYVPGRLSITYKQVWEAPYVGLQFLSAWDRWSLQGRVIGSWWAGGQDHDYHHLRPLVFDANFGQSNMIGANAHIGYRLTDNWSLKVEYDLQKWQLAKGPTYQLNPDTGQETFSAWNAEGADSVAQTVLLGAMLEY